MFASSSSSSVFSTRFFERTIFFRRYEGKQFYIITRKEFKQMSRDHLLNSDPKKVWNFSLAGGRNRLEATPFFFVFGRFFVFLDSSRH